jgi:Protein of unknown function (DUF2924)
MQLDIIKEPAAPRRMRVGELRAKYAEVFGEATPTKNRPWLVKRIAWRMQALAEGDLSERARQRAEELARDAGLRLRPPADASATTPEPSERTSARTIPFKSDERLPMAGTVLTRRFKGEDLQVRVLGEGFEFEGNVYGSLSAVARVITGPHCNGYHFFREVLNGNGGDR